MKNTFIVTLFIFGIVVTAILSAGLTAYEFSKPNSVNQGLEIVDNNGSNIAEGNINNSAGVNNKLLGASVVAQHNKQSDCWMVVDGKVYNITSYMTAHPGGTQTLVSSCGKEATDLFAGILGGHKHSGTAYDILKNYYVGDFQIKSVSGQNTGTTNTIDTNVLPTSQPINNGGEDEFEDD
ncbi:TPA: hypothetical protein DCZ46_03460 [Candidatus Campbellbacteria bacterium]|nr:MAG: hypothetical protein UR58_C0001G0662 [Candidatus Campbellbacteria bacterium GW2011_OD1_34_28]KKP74813.1 MAG: hypothetical protein UR74_C0002G0079 [Candidatus Campbellbacteria bacterium GW2011_GWD2_35_24]KKP75699.1 MAG: hypothetical protein UR75_C0002G0080 [Candidatus Campbellbacteria bacterium GW2011_GWC2_35_28]KKP77053.1 MAG: hypothetical protein UR76_C0002G0254 [Candidatus Campbellbacteria bacterium GW2011_GWC1_35_31]KKP78979.1 MAG: hypothetical protein UR79_C0002G0254 [Candidatus Cam